LQFQAILKCLLGPQEKYPNFNSERGNERKREGERDGRREIKREGQRESEMILCYL